MPELPTGIEPSKVDVVVYQTRIQCLTEAAREFIRKKISEQKRDEISKVLKEAHEVRRPSRGVTQTLEGIKTKERDADKKAHWLRRHIIEPIKKTTLRTAGIRDPEAFRSLVRYAEENITVKDTVTYEILKGPSNLDLEKIKSGEYVEEPQNENPLLESPYAEWTKTRPYVYNSLDKVFFIKLLGGPNDPIAIIESLKILGLDLTIHGTGGVHQLDRILPLVKAPGMNGFLKALVDAGFHERFLSYEKQEALLAIYIVHGDQLTPKVIEDLSELGKVIPLRISARKFDAYLALAPDTEKREFLTLVLSNEITIDLDSDTELPAISEMVDRLKRDGLLRPILELARNGIELKGIFYGLISSLPGHINFSEQDEDSLVALKKFLQECGLEQPDQVETLVSPFAQEIARLMEREMRKEDLKKYRELEKEPESLAIIFLLKKWDKKSTDDTKVLDLESAFERDFDNLLALIKNKSFLGQITDPRFITFMDTLVEKCGYTFTLHDLYRDQQPSEQNLAGLCFDPSLSDLHLPGSFELLSDMGFLKNHADLLKALWFLNIQGAIPSLKNLRESFGYILNASDVHLRIDLEGYLKDRKQQEELQNDHVKTFFRRLQEEYGYQFSFSYRHILIAYAKNTLLHEKIFSVKFKKIMADIRLNDPSYQFYLRDVEKLLLLSSEMGEFIKDIKDIYRFKIFDVEKIAQLSQFPSPELMRLVARMTKDFNFQFDISYVKRLLLMRRDKFLNTLEQYLGHIKLTQYVFDHYEKIRIIPPKDLPMYLEIMERIEDSPSQEIKRMKNEICDQILKSPSPREAYSKTEDIFVKNNLPTVGKVFKVYEALYPSIDYSTVCSSALTHSKPRRRRAILYRDLLRIHVLSGNQSLRDFVQVLKSGQEVLDDYETLGIGALDDRQKNLLAVFLSKISTLYLSSQRGCRSELQIDTRDIERQVEQLKQSLQVKDGQKISERITEMFLKPAGINDSHELLTMMTDAKKNSHQRGLELAKHAAHDNAGKMTISAGDLLKGVDGHYLGNILENGSVAKEFLGGSSDSDNTPLDTDLSLVMSDDSALSFTEAVGRSIASQFGDIILCVKERGQFTKTEKNVPAAKGLMKEATDGEKYELFPADVYGPRHYCIRTGFPSTEIDFIILNGALENDPQSQEKIFFQIVEHGYYIPVTDSQGKIIFTPEMYKARRRCFQGLDRFDGDPYEYQPLDEDDPHASELERVRTETISDREKVRDLSRKIHGCIAKVLQDQFNIRLRTEYDSSMESADLTDIGSTGRATNMPGAFDFDFNLRLNTRDFKRSAEIAQAIKQKLGNYTDTSHQEASGYYQLRAGSVSQLDGEQLKTPIDIDIGFACQSDLMTYAPFDALEDKLASIKSHAGEEAYENVLANIILTKQILKRGHAYKHLEEGGLGGIGVENWILTHGGNMIEAFRSFRDAAYENGIRVSLDIFKKKYPIYDAGINLKTGGHNNYTEILEKNGYIAMLDSIEKYLQKERSSK